MKLDAELHGCANGERAFTGNVLYMSTLSKTLAPGLRIAWVVAPEVVITKLVQIKQGADLHTSTFCQYVAYEVARGGFLDRHVRRIRRVYGERRDAMLSSLDAPRPAAASAGRGRRAGFSSGPRCRRGSTPRRSSTRRSAEKVAFVPGAAFYPCGGGEETMRLNFSYAPPDVIEEGIKRLARVIERKKIERVLRRWCGQPAFSMGFGDPRGRGFTHPSKKVPRPLFLF